MTGSARERMGSATRRYFQALGYIHLDLYPHVHVSVMMYDKQNWNARDARMNCVTDTPDGAFCDFSRFLDGGPAMFG